MAGARNFHHTDAPPPLPATAGSPASLVAPLLPAVTLPTGGSRAVAEANPSFFSGTKKFAVIGSAQPPLTCTPMPDGLPEYSTADGAVASLKSTWPLAPGNTSAGPPR